MKTLAPLLAAAVVGVVWLVVTEVDAWVERRRLARRDAFLAARWRARRR